VTSSATFGAICVPFQTILVAILLLLNVVNIHALWIYELLPNNQCGIDVQRRDFEAVVWPWISAIVNVYLPLMALPFLASVLIWSQKTCESLLWFRSCQQNIQLRLIRTESDVSCRSNEIKKVVLVLRLAWSPGLVAALKNGHPEKKVLGKILVCDVLRSS